MTELTDKNRWTALYVLCTGVLMIVLDITVVNVALPSIQKDLGFSQGDLAWVINIYIIAFAGLLLLSGRLGDLISRRGIFLWGLTLFTVTSVVCGFAQSQEMLIIGRFVQGIGGAMASAVVLGMIVTMFPEPREQAKAIGIYGFVASAGGSVGLIAGGLLTEVDWHWIFMINVPIGIATLVATRRLIPNDKGIGLDKGADAIGATLLTAGLMLLVYTIVKPAAEDGWGATNTIVLTLISLALLAAFIAREATAKTPLIPLRIFRSRNISGANIVQAISVAGMFGIFFLGSLYLQRVLGYSPFEIGLAFLPATLIMGTLSVRYAEPLVMRFGAKNVLVVGLAFVMVAMLGFARAPVDGQYWIDLFPVQVLFGIGAGTAFPALMMVAMSDATPEDAGLASGLINTTAEFGGAIGLAVLATLSASRTDDLRAAGEPLKDALTSGYHTSFLVATGLVFITIVVALTVIRPVKQPMHAPSGEPAMSEA